MHGFLLLSDPCRELAGVAAGLAGYAMTAYQNDPRYMPGMARCLPGSEIEVVKRAVPTTAAIQKLATTSSYTPQPAASPILSNSLAAAAGVYEATTSMVPPVYTTAAPPLMANGVATSAGIYEAVSTSTAASPRVKAAQIIGTTVRQTSSGRVTRQASGNLPKGSGSMEFAVPATVSVEGASVVAAAGSPTFVAAAPVIAPPMAFTPPVPSRASAVFSTAQISGAEQVLYEAARSRSPSPPVSPGLRPTKVSAPPYASVPQSAYPAQQVVRAVSLGSASVPSPMDLAPPATGVHVEQLERQLFDFKGLLRQTQERAAALVHERDHRINMLDRLVEDQRQALDVQRRDTEDLRRYHNALLMANREQAQRLTDLEAALRTRELPRNAQTRSAADLDRAARSADLDRGTRSPDVDRAAPASTVLGSDRIDQRIQEYLETFPEFNFFVEKLRQGWYKFGKPISKKVYMKVVGNDIVVRVGGGYKELQKFLDEYRLEWLEGRAMLEDVEQMRDRQKMQLMSKTMQNSRTKL